MNNTGTHDGDLCGCCEGVEAITPEPVANRPGLDALTYRTGTHATFLETMVTRLSQHRLILKPDELLPDMAAAGSDLWPLRALQTRAPDDPAIAFLDAWATVADVLTFYQERIANEGFLRTATERRSVLELARLVGHRPRPGVAASVYLAFTVEDGYQIVIPKGSRAQSTPLKDEVPQAFETSSPLPARSEWNILRPRTSRPAYLPLPLAERTGDLYLDGTATNLRANDALLLVYGSLAGQQVVRKVAVVEAQYALKRTWVKLQAEPGQKQMAPAGQGAITKPVLLDDLVGPLTKPRSIPPANTQALVRTRTGLFGKGSGVGDQLLLALKPGLAEVLQPAWGNAAATPPSSLQSLQAMRVNAGVFGRTAPLQQISDENGKVIGQEEWPLTGAAQIAVRLFPREAGGLLFLAAMPAGIATDLGFVRLSIQAGGRRRTAAAGLKDGEARLGDDAVRIKVNGPPDALSVVVIFEGRDRTYEFKRMGDQWAVIAQNQAGDKLGEWELTMQEELTEPVAGGEINAGINGRDGVYVSEKLLLPPDPCNVIDLDTVYDAIVPGGWVVIERAGHPGLEHVVAWIDQVQKVQRIDYSLTATVTRLVLVRGPDDSTAAEWLSNDDRLLSDVRNTVVYAGSEALALAEEPITDPVCDAEIELDGLYDGLESGRWLIVAGERTDVPGATGVMAAELVMIEGVRQDVAQIAAASGAPGLEVAPHDVAEVKAVALPGDRVHTFVRLATGLSYCYKRESLAIYGNVAEATHGETRSEVLGSGDGSKPFQTFVLKQLPLTYVPAATPAGAESTLEVRVNGVRAHEDDSLIDLAPDARGYVVRRDDGGEESDAGAPVDEKTSVIFGDGIHGARLPTGQENLAAVYRKGIGRAGNVKARQIDQLVTRVPLGMKGVLNPLPATGGADKDSRDDIRERAPLGVAALDRLVSVQDYADFARTFAGIGKASAARLPSGRGQVVHVTVAGKDDIPIVETDALYRNLLASLHTFGEPYLPIRLAPRELKLAVIGAAVKVQPDYLWELVAPVLRKALLDAFGFGRRDLGQPLWQSEVVAAMQRVPGVAYVRMDTFAGVDETTPPSQLLNLAGQLGLEAAIAVELASAQRDPATGQMSISPAQLVMLSPQVADTLFLTELTNDR